MCEPSSREKILDHEVVLDEQGKLLPWTSYTNILKWTMNFIKNCPTIRTRFGDDPYYLVTSYLNSDGTFVRNQNTQGCNFYGAVETLKRYYAYTGDRDAFKPVTLLADRILHYHTPKNWAWPNIPRTQDGDSMYPLDPSLELDADGHPINFVSTANGEYTDQWSESDKICMVAVAYIGFYKLTGHKKYLHAAVSIADVIARNINTADAENSPLPYRVNLKTGEILDCYTSNMIPAVKLFDELNKLGFQGPENIYRTKRDIILQWILRYPINNNKWSGYFEDNKSGQHENRDQQSPMETARYILRNPDIDPEYKKHIPDLLKWVKNRFGQTERYGAVSIMEQDVCMMEMSSHTARYASILAKWFAVTADPEVRQQALRSLALATYSVYNKYSKNENAINYVGVGHQQVWFSDGYFDYMPHILEAIAELPEMTPENEDHIIDSTSVVTKAEYKPGHIEYETFNPDGQESIRLAFEPKVFTAGKELDRSRWSFGDYRSVSNILRIDRNGISKITIKKDDRK